MSELAPLREAVDELAGRSPMPDFAALERRATRRGRRRTAALVAGVGLVVAGAGSSLALGGLRGGDQLAPLGEPGKSSSPSPTGSSTANPEAVRMAFGQELDEILGQSPGWSVRTGGFPRDYDYAFNGPCAGDWSEGATSGGDGGAAGASGAGAGQAGFASADRAATAAALLVENLATCTATAWQTRPIPSTGAVLAASEDAVVWIQRTEDTVDVLQVRTSDGLPPADVQVEVAEWMADFRTWDEQS